VYVSSYSKQHTTHVNHTTITYQASTALYFDAYSDFKLLRTTEDLTFV